MKLSAIMKKYNGFAFQTLVQARMYVCAEECTNFCDKLRNFFITTKHTTTLKLFMTLKW